MRKRTSLLPTVVAVWFISSNNLMVVAATKQRNDEENTKKRRNIKNPLKQLVHRAFQHAGKTFNKKGILEKKPPHPFFQEERLAHACGSGGGDDDDDDHDDDCSLTKIYNKQQQQRKNPPLHAFVGMQLHVFRRDLNHKQDQSQSSNELPAPENDHDVIEQQQLPSTDSTHTPLRAEEEDEEENNYDSSFIYEKAYRLDEPLFLELGKPQRHRLDYAYSPVITQADFDSNSHKEQPPQGSRDDDKPSQDPDTTLDDPSRTDSTSETCTDLVDNVFSSWWKWWLPWNTSIAAHGSERSDYYETFAGAFAGGSHGEVWRGRRICKEKRGLMKDDEVCDDQKPLILKRLRVENGYRLLEAGLREIYIGQWLRHEISVSQQSLYTSYIDHFFRETSLPRAFGRYPKSRQLELWVVFEDAGPSLRSYLYNPISSEGGFVMYQPSNLWSQMRTSNMEKQRRTDDDSSITLQMSQSSSTDDDTQKASKVKNIGREIFRTVLRQILSATALLHENGFVHRDIKPSNVMCISNVELKDLYSLEEAPNIQCKLGDFSSVWSENYIAESLYTKGPSPAEQTDEYAPPESYIGPDWVPFDHKQPQSYDLWSIGVLALEMLLGTPNVFSVDQRTTALLTNKMKKENASDEELQRALYLAALSHFCIYMPGKNSTKQQRWPLAQGDPLHKTAMVKESCTLQDFHRALRARDPLGTGFESSADLLLHLVWQLLAWDPIDRMTAAEALQHPYFTSPDGTHQSLQWQMITRQQNADPRFDLSSRDAPIDEFTCPKCGRIFSDWYSCHVHANSRKHGKFCTYDRSSLPTCINTHSMLPAHPTSGYCDLQGRRSVIEDFHSIHLHSSVQFYGIFDGHTGNLASKYVASTMYNQLVTHLGDLEEILKNPTWKAEVTHNVSLAFQEIHEEFLEGLSLAPSAMDQSGTTATALFVTEEAIVVSSIGDSRAVLSSTGPSGISAIQLTRDHVASDPDERDKVIRRGGSVSSAGSIARVNGTLAITRSIGDANLSPVLSRIPHVVSMRREEIRQQCGENREIPCFVVLASDGLWDVMSNQEAVDMVAQVVAAYDATDRVSWNNGGAFQEAAEVLAIDAYVRGSSDNIGVCVVAVDDNYKTHVD